MNDDDESQGIEDGSDGPTTEPLAAELRVLAHLERAGALIRGARHEDAERELLHALAVGPGDMRALKLLALVRYKLGRWGEARETYQVLARAAPDDASVHLNLGLVALKLDWLDEAVAELESASRLGPEDKRTWGYLGYAYARTGRSGLSIEAFRRAGQEELAREVEASVVEPLPAPPVAPERPPRGEAVAPGESVTAKLPRPAAVPAQPDGSGFFPVGGSRAKAAGGSLLVEGFAPAADALDDPFADGGEDPSTLTSFVLARLLVSSGASDEGSGAPEKLQDGVLRVPVSEGTHLRASALMAVAGDIPLLPARARARGRFLDGTLGTGAGVFVVCGSAGEVWMVPHAREAKLEALTLEEDILYVRQELVLGFEGGLAWEAGELPRDGLALMQFRGSGRVVLELGRESFLALKLPAEGPLLVDRRRLLGWVGRVVVETRPPVAGALTLIACEGEGVLLLTEHVDVRKPMEERAQSGDDGPRAPDPGRPSVHR